MLISLDYENFLAIASDNRIQLTFNDSTRSWYWWTYSFNKNEAFAKNLTGPFGSALEALQNACLPFMSDYDFTQ